MDQLDVAGPDEHRHDRHASGDEDLRLVGMERRGRHEVVMEPVEPLGKVVEQRAFGLDHPREGVDQALGVVAGVGVGAFGEQHPNERAGSLALGRGGERRGGQLVGREPGVARPAEHLGHDPGQRLGAAPLRRSLGDMGAGAMAAGDVAGVGQPSIDGADRVGVDPQRGAELADRGEASPRQQPAGIDLVGDLPEDLGRDRDVRIALDVERSAGAACRR